MGFRFRKSVRFGKLVRLNFSGSGVSLGLGPRGANVNISKRGVRQTVGIPGSGLSYQSFKPWQPSRPSVDPGLVELQPAPARASRSWLPYACIAAVLLAIFLFARGNEPKPAVVTASPATPDTAPTVAPERPNRSLTAAEVRDAQVLLKRFGRDPGEPDGIVGPRTIKAVKLFEAARGWPVSGAVDLRLLDYLKDPRNAIPSPPQSSAAPKNQLGTVDGSAADTALAMRVLRSTTHPCPSLVRAARVSDGSVRAVCSNGETYRIMQVNGEWLALKCSAAERAGVKGC